MSTYQITIEPSLCSGFGACVDVARNLFELPKGGVARAVHAETSDARALDAAVACPMGAIFVEETAAA